MSAGTSGDRVALEGPGREPLTHAGLVAERAQAADTLRRLGLAGRRVALVAGSSPELAACFLAVSDVGAAAPLNPSSTAAELAADLDLVGAAAVIVGEGAGAARDAAERAGVPVLGLQARDGTAGRFDLHAGSSWREPGGDPVPGDGDVALLLRTSGTTSRPKLVPLTRANLAASAANIANVLALGPGDRGLVVMPLFHVHGLVAGLLAPLARGGSVWCPHGFDGLRFFTMLAEARPTWFTAVPSMHAAVLARADRGAHRAIARQAGLRFVRSSSAPLRPEVALGIEALFDAPVVEAYGMTEATHQICSNPLPPGERVLGSVGPAAGAEVAVRTDDGRIVAAGAGEIVIRGASVTTGYLGEGEHSAFVDGWLRTGDLGAIDDRGYVRLTGRLKELINRGGEKISPVEIDAVLHDHPGVAQAIAFAVPHDHLGEEIAAAVVLHAGADVGAPELRAFARERLAAFKVPRHVVIVDSIPTGPTGKFARSGLAARLGLA